MKHRDVLTVTIAICVAISLPAQAGASLGPSGQPVYLNTPVSAPAPPGGTRPESNFTWERCSFWQTLAEQDGANGMTMFLGDAGHDASNTASLWITGEFSGAHSLVSPGPLEHQGAAAASHFDGVSSKLVLLEAPDPGNGAPFSIEMWVRPTVIDAKYRYLYSRELRDGGVREGTGIWLSNSGLGFERFIAGHGYHVTYAPGLQINRWSQVFATYDGQYMRLYVNASPVASLLAPGVVGPVGELSTVGAGEQGSSGFFEGDIGDLALFKNAVPRYHVATEYHEGRDEPCVVAGTGPTYVPRLEDLGRTLRVTSRNLTQSSTYWERTPVQYNRFQPGVSFGAVNDLAEGHLISGSFPITATLSGLPAGEVSFEIDGRVRYSKTGEPPYQYLWNTAAAANGPHTISMTVQGPNNGAPTHSHVSVQVEN